MVSPKDVVLAVMTVAGKETKKVTEKGKEVDRMFIALRCPKPSCAVKNISIKEGTGYMNPYSHLRACYGRGKGVAEQRTAPRTVICQLTQQMCLLTK